MYQPILDAIHAQPIITGMLAGAVAGALVLVVRRGIGFVLDQIYGQKYWHIDRDGNWQSNRIK